MGKFSEAVGKASFFQHSDATGKCGLPLAPGAQRGLKASLGWRVLFLVQSLSCVELLQKKINARGRSLSQNVWGIIMGGRVLGVGAGGQHLSEIVSTHECLSLPFTGPMTQRSRRESAPSSPLYPSFYQFILLPSRVQYGIK